MFGHDTGLRAGRSSCCTPPSAAVTHLEQESGCIQDSFCNKELLHNKHGNYQHDFINVPCSGLCPSEHETEWCPLVWGLLLEQLALFLFFFLKEMRVPALCESFFPYGHFLTPPPTCGCKRFSPNAVCYEYFHISPGKSIKCLLFSVYVCLHMWQCKRALAGEILVNPFIQVLQTLHLSNTCVKQVGHLTQA